MNGLLVIMANGATCISSASLANHHWIPGDYRVIPVTRPIEPEFRSRIDRDILVKINRSQAASLVSNELPQVPYYYLTDAMFFGNEGQAEALPPGVQVFFTADTDKTAYVFSFRLGNAQAIAEAPVVLSSILPLKDAVRVCDGAI